MAGTVVRTTARQWVPPEKRGPVHKQTATTLYAELVLDGTLRYATPLQRFVEAVGEIARQQRTDRETVMQRLEADVHAQSGHGLPLA